MRYAPLFAAALLLASCTRSSGASTERVEVPIPAPTIEADDGPDGAEQVPASLDAGRPVAAMDVPPAGPQFALVARSDAVFEMLTVSSDRHELVAVPPLEPGQAPDEQYTIEGFTVSPSGEVFFSKRSPDGEALVWRQRPGAFAEPFASGTHPQVDVPTGDLFVLMDGALVRTAIDGGLEEQRIEFEHPVVSYHVEPAGDLLVAEVVGPDHRSIQVVSLADPADRASLPMPVDAQWAGPRWRRAGQISVVDHRADGDHVVVLDTTSGAVLERIALDDQLVTTDWDGSGVWLVFTTADGDVAWVGDGLTGVMASDEFEDATW